MLVLNSSKLPYIHRATKTDVSRFLVSSECNSIPNSNKPR
nr:MAG TPA: hypothetical protein [Caudoviricetes sp.]